MLYTVNTPEGTKDRLFDECGERRQVQSRLTGLFKRRGYSEIITPEVEFYDVFLQSGSPMPQENMVKLIDRSGRVLVLRPDCTAPIARVAATKLQNIPLPQRLYYNQTVFRSGKANSGSSQEIAQCGVELIGASGRKADLEVLVLAVDCLKGCGLSSFQIEIGHAGLFHTLAQGLGASPMEVEQMRFYLEEKNFAMLDESLLPYQDKEGYEALRRLPYLFGGPEVLAEAQGLCGEAARPILDALGEIYTLLEEAGCGLYIRFDLGLAHELEYYTGVVFRGYAEGAGSAVLSGGRYDRLLERFGRVAPATGFAVDVDAVAATLPPVEKAHQAAMLIHYEIGDLRGALACLEGGRRGERELSPCQMLEDTLALGKEKGASGVIVLKDGREEVITV